MSKPLKIAEVEARLRPLLDRRGLSDADLRAELEVLAKEPAFTGLTWLYGPHLHARNQVFFRPFLLSHFSAMDPTHWKRIPWKDHATGLEAWLQAVDQANDIELFRALYSWKVAPSTGFMPDAARIRADLLTRYTAARRPAERQGILARFDIWFDLDEATALALYRTDPRSSVYILRRLPRVMRFIGGEKRVPWERLWGLARDDHDFYWTLYRMQVPQDRWRQDVLALCDGSLRGEDLVAGLEERHIAGFGMDPGPTFRLLAEKRGREVFPYLAAHLRELGTWQNRQGYVPLLDLARDRGWLDLWSAIVRTCADAARFNQEVARLLADRAMSDAEVERRLLLLVGVSREWNFPGLGIAQVHVLNVECALQLYLRLPHLARGPFRLHLSPTWNVNYERFITVVIDLDDEDLLDFMASRFVTRSNFAWDKQARPVVEMLANHYEHLRMDAPTFARRSAAVLGQVPPFTIPHYNDLIRNNRLARLLFERSGSRFLDAPRALQDLVEAPEIHVHALAYRCLGLDDPRARQIAADNLEILLGTLLRPLHRGTRILAFGALLNAAHSIENARRIHDRAREALSLPDHRYPKEQLVGLLGRLLHRWPELRSASEQPLIYGPTEARP